MSTGPSERHCGGPCPSPMRGSTAHGETTEMELGTAIASWVHGSLRAASDRHQPAEIEFMAQRSDLSVSVGPSKLPARRSSRFDGAQMGPAAAAFQTCGVPKRRRGRVSQATMAHRWLVPFVASLIAACAPPRAADSTDDRGQPFGVALALICSVDEHAGVSADDDEITVEGKRLEWLDSQIKNPDALEYRTLLRVATIEDQAQSLAHEAKAHGLERCTLAETLRKASAADP